MSVTSLTKHEAVPVNIAAATVYCDGFKASSTRNISEESTCDGGTVFTNDACRSTKLIFSGRIFSDYSADFILQFNSLVRSNSSFSVEYMGLTFSSCRMLSYTFDSKGEDWAAVTVTLITPDNIIRSDET
ncbi:hypothetical protein [Ruminococcus flavefaciens]|uniref:hypothetical protein n=1 Tax=Ruminococcus flavefaciens TaxID=1265 RepID=UPI0026F1FCD1|nr:hypothetical protein [Ruminococcus flavefaciens]MDD7517884.1 hypothetical protein [Ruminococcus flavefaciens]MDY5691871.1 hypothetical protein [Ruminococcus flavefaciens]